MWQRCITNKDVHPVGEGLPDSMRVYRVKVVTVVLKAGVPPSKIDIFRDLLEEHAFSLSTSLPDLVNYFFRMK